MNDRDANKTENKAVVLKKVLAQYGAFGMGVHITLSLMSLGLTYLLVMWGLDVEGLLKGIGLDMTTVTLAPGAEYSATFVAAYTVHKMIFPLRATVSVVTIRYLVRYLRRAGFFKK